MQDAPVLVIACGALVREIRLLTAANKPTAIDLRAVPAIYHNRPEKIAPAVARRIAAARGKYRKIFVAYGECGTAGALDRLLEREGIERLPGAHCYAFFSGVETFARRTEEDMRCFFLTDFLARHFRTLVIGGLGLDRHPELRPIYFGHYEKVVYLSQLPDSSLIKAAQAAAAALGLAFEHRPVGFGDLAMALNRFMRGPKDSSLLRPTR
ncbi:MAG: DUF1638 domain-containing protein [Hyphomicrobiaceae bacterium]